MINHRTFKTKVIVRFVRRDDGGLRAHCDEVNGFYLSGADPRAVLRDVVPALETLVHANLDIAVQVSPLGYGLFQLTEHEKPAFEVISSEPEYLKEYVVELAA